MSQKYMIRHKPVTSKLILKELEHTTAQRETTEIEANKTLEQDETLEQDKTVELEDEVLSK